MVMLQVLHRNITSFVLMWLSPLPFIKAPSRFLSIVPFVGNVNIE